MDPLGECSADNTNHDNIISTLSITVKDSAQGEAGDLLSHIKKYSQPDSNDEPSFSSDGNVSILNSTNSACLATKTGPKGRHTLEIVVGLGETEVDVIHEEGEQDGRAKNVGGGRATKQMDARLHLSTEHRSIEESHIQEEVEEVIRNSDSTTNRLRPTFMNIPIELRLKIFRLLLRNPVLGKAEAILQDTGYGQDSKYELYPAIVRTCKQTCSEAYEVLYGENIFFATCFSNPSSSVRYCLPISALTRYHGQWDKALSEFPGILNVRKWKVILSPIDERRYDGYNPTLFGRLCGVLAKNPPLTLEVGVLLRQVEHEHYLYYNTYRSIADILSPMKMLRNIASFDIKDIEHFDVPTLMLSGAGFAHRDADEMSFVSNFEKEPRLIEELKHMVNESKAAEYPFEMLPLLIAYAGAFERYESFKRDMSFDRHRSHRKDMEETYGWSFAMYSSKAYFNPFRCPFTYFSDKYHPVEEGLVHAIESQNSIDGFKAARKAVLEYLEPQYDMIYRAATDMRNFVLDQKRAGEFPDVDWRRSDMVPWREEFEFKAILNLQAYANSFKRHVPANTAYEIKMMKGHFELLYSEMEREQAISETEKHIELGAYDYACSSFQTAVDDMDKQFAEIRKARRELFKLDHLATDFPIGTDKWRWEFEDAIDWSQNEH